MRTFLRATVALVMIVTGAVVLTPEAGSTSSPADVRTYEAQGLVQATDIEPLTPVREGFVLDDDATLSEQAASARRADGTVAIYVRPDTKFYKYDAAAGGWKPSSYDEVVTAGALLKVGGRYVDADGSKQLTATFVWAPPPPSQSRPANPGPSVLRDFTFQRTFNVLGSATQRGIRMPTNGLYCAPCGFVIGNLTDTGGDPLVQAIAAAHVGQLIITSTPATKYYVQGADGQFHPSSLDQTVSTGAPLRVAGKYAFVDSDWRFLATYVWQPSPEFQRGTIQWITVTDSTGKGANVAGSTEVYPGTTSLSVSWTPDGTGSWNVEGTWTAGDAGGKGTVSGTLSGTWDPASGDVDAVAILDHGTGRHFNVTGSGHVIGSAFGPVASPPSSTRLSFNLAVERTPVSTTTTTTAPTTTTSTTAPTTTTTAP